MKRPRIQWWRNARLRRNNRALRELVGRLVALIDRAKNEIWEGDNTTQFQTLTEEARRLAAARDGGA